MSDHEKDIYSELPLATANFYRVGKITPDCPCHSPTCQRCVARGRSLAYNHTDAQDHNCSVADAMSALQCFGY